MDTIGTQFSNLWKSITENPLATALVVGGVYLVARA